MATAVIRQGDFIDQYKISDPGNASGFDNNLIYISHRVDEVLRQTSSIDFHTFKENLLCWGGEVVECPCDDAGQGGQLSEGMCFLDSIMAAGGITVGADLTDLAEKSIYLGFWHEYRMNRLVVEDSITQMVLEGLNELQQRRALKFIYVGNGIDIDIAQSLANNRITNGVEATYDEYGLATIPLQDRRLLKLFGEVGWFDDNPV